MKNTTVTSIRIDKDIWKEAKRVSHALELKLSDFIGSAIIHEIQRTKR